MARSSLKDNARRLRRHVPHLDAALASACTPTCTRGQHLAVGRVGEGYCRGGMSGERKAPPPCSHVPEFERTVFPSDGENLAIRRKRHRAHHALAPCERRQQPARVEIPQPYALIPAPRRNRLTVRRDGQTPYQGFVSGEHGPLFPQSHVPHSDVAIRRSRQQSLAIGRKRQGIHCLPLGTTQGAVKVAVAEPPEVIPVKAAQVFLIEPWPLTFEQLQGARRLPGFPGLLRQVDLRGIKAPAGEQLLLLGGLRVFLCPG